VCLEIRSAAKGRVGVGDERRRKPTSLDCLRDLLKGVERPFAKPPGQIMA
jgi:hypothetical protein